MTEGDTPERDQAEAVLRLPKSDPLAQKLVEAIHAGEVERVKDLITENRGLAAARLVDHKGGSGTSLHAATDWPGYFPNGPQIVSVLIDTGARPEHPRGGELAR